MTLQALRSARPIRRDDIRLLRRHEVKVSTGTTSALLPRKEISNSRMGRKTNFVVSSAAKILALSTSCGDNGCPAHIDELEPSPQLPKFSISGYTPSQQKLPFEIRIRILPMFSVWHKKLYANLRACWGAERLGNRPISNRCVFKGARHSLFKSVMSRCFTI